MRYGRNISALAAGITVVFFVLPAAAQTLPANYLRKNTYLPAPALPIAAQPLPATLPPDFHTRHFGFFCRQELKMQRAAIPFTFRLGNMEQCNRLEGKPGYR